MKKIIIVIGIIVLFCNSGLAQHWVIFFAYPAREKTPAHDYSIAGHTYVSFVTRDQSTRQTVVDEIWGFHPVEQSLKAIFYVEKGKMLPESITEAEYDFVVEVKDEIVYQNCRRVKEIWDKKNYSIIAGQTCVDYAKDVVSKITSLDIPNEFSDKWPKDFLLDLRLKNSRTDQLGRKSLSAIPDANPNSLNQLEANGSPLYGYWEGAAKYPEPLTYDTINFDIQKDPNSENVLITAYHIKSGITKTETLKGTFNGKALEVPFRSPQVNDNKKYCNGFLYLHSAGKDYVSGFFETEASDVDDTKLDCRTVFYTATRKNKALNNQTNIIFKINPKDVTLATDKDFKWYDWDKAPQDLKTAARYIHTFKNQQTQKDEILFDEINQNLKEKCNVKIAAIDLNDDGICGVAMFADGGSWCCGSRGCSFRLYENGGLLTVDLGTDEVVKPIRNGVMSSTNKFFPIKTNPRITVDAMEISKLFTYEKIKQNQTNIINTGSLVGGTTADELGRVLLKALQTNNKQLWSNCIHPYLEKQDQSYVNKREDIIKRFEYLRDFFTSEGISNWNLVKLSRVTYSTCAKCDIAVAYPEEKLLVGMEVEFWYQDKEFLGTISFTPVWTFKGKYFIGGGHNYSFMRNKAK